MLNSKIDFIGIGFAKCGTTTIANLLEEHPEICMAIPKEVQYFNPSRSFYHENLVNNNYSKGENWYINHWSHQKNEHVRGEISPQYIQSVEGLERIKNDLPFTKIIVFLRNPAEIAFSFYGMAVNHHQANLPDFSEAIRSHKDIRERMFLSEKVGNCLSFFGHKQIYFFVLEDFIKDRKASIKALFTFLGVDENYSPPSLFEVFNAASTTKFLLIRNLEKFIVSFLASRGLTSWVKKMKKWPLVKNIQKLNAQIHVKSELQKEDRIYIYKEVVEDVNVLGKLINRDLNFWLKMKV